MVEEGPRSAFGREIGGLQEEFERLLRQVVAGIGAATSPQPQPTPAGAFSPPLDVEEDDERFVLHVELPGVRGDEVDLALEEGVLTVSGQREFYGGRDREGFRRIERRFGRFHRAVRLPERIDADRVEATYEDGMLRVVVPKADASRARRIRVRTA